MKRNKHIERWKVGMYPFTAIVIFAVIIKGLFLLYEFASENMGCITALFSTLIFVPYLLGLYLDKITANQEDIKEEMKESRKLL